MLIAVACIFICSSAAIIGSEKYATGRVGLSSKSVLTNKQSKYSGFSLSSGYKYRGTSVFSTQPETIRLHSTIYNSRNTSYIVPQGVRSDLFNGKLVLHPTTPR